MAIKAKVTAMVIEVECGKCGESVHNARTHGSQIFPGDDLKFDGKNTFIDCQACGAKNIIGTYARI